MQRADRLVFSAVVFTLAVITLGAFVRLSEAGLGCPDWPGCYGRVVVPAELARAGLEAHTRAWIEMIHRYAAGTLGLLILLAALRYWPERRRRPLIVGILALLLLQALLGMWTVTLKLMPLTVMGHLLGGLALLSLLWWWHLNGTRRIGTVAGAALAAVTIQIALGGWTSANYAGIACPDLPTCQSSWWPEADFRHAFTLPDAVDGSYQGGEHTGAGRTAIHLAHRLGALAACAAVLLFVARLLRRPSDASRRAGVFLLAALLLQVGLGVTNVLLHLPLSAAVAHTAGAAVLLLALLHAARQDAIPPASSTD